MNTANTPKKIPVAYFLVPLLIQLGIILLIPSKSFSTYKTGQDVVIQTRPVDPYDFLRGYSQTLSYDISQVRDLKKLPGGKQLKKGNVFYVVLQAPDNTDQKPPKPWEPVSIKQTQPKDLSSNQIALKGVVKKYNRVKYGLERYYMPEDQRDQINEEIRDLNLVNRNLERDSENRSDRRRPFVVSIKVGKDGHSVPVSLWLGDRNYKF